MTLGFRLETYKDEFNVAFTRGFEHLVRLERDEGIQRATRRAAGKQRAGVVLGAELPARHPRHRLGGTETGELSRPGVGG